MQTELQARIAIVDDDEAIRESIQLLLFAAGLNGLPYASAQEFLGHREREPDCLLLDIRMPGMDGLELFGQLRRAGAPYPVIFITGHGDIPLAVTAIKQGAFDFLTKPFREGELLQKIQTALTHYSSVRSELQSQQLILQRIDSCTPREQEVMRLMAEGLPNKGIAAALDISPRTVEIHRAHVMEKMAAGSLPELVRMLARTANFD
jgi:FixJ family two-component response regulator